VTCIVQVTRFGGTESTVRIRGLGSSRGTSSHNT
jgi:hypothetical protein